MKDWDLAALAAAAGAVVARPAGPIGGKDDLQQKTWPYARARTATQSTIPQDPPQSSVPRGSSRSPVPKGAIPQSPGPRSPVSRGPVRVNIDSRSIAQGDLFVGLPGERHDGGAYAAEALRAGAWGVLVTPGHAEALPAGGAVLVHEDPLASLQSLAGAWLAELRAGGVKVVAITGSTGKTSTKDILAALLGPKLPTFASPANLNTEIGLPLAILGAPAGTKALVLEMAMRGQGQIAELTAIAEPDVGLIVNVGPVHLELLGTVAAVAAAKAELLEGLAPGATAIVPAGEPLLEPYLREDLKTVRFGPGGDVRLAERRPDGTVVIEACVPVAASASRTADELDGRLGIADRARPALPERIALKPSFGQAHNLENLVAAVAGALALGVTPGGEVKVRFSAMRGQRVSLPGGTTVIDDCYNANPMSMKAALDDLAETASGRRVAVLGDMLELGGDELSYHHEIGAYARARGVDFLLTVGPLAAAAADAFAGYGQACSVPDAIAAADLLTGALEPGDTVLVKGSRGVGLERVVEALCGHGERPARVGDRAEAQPGGREEPEVGGRDESRVAERAEPRAGGR